MIRDKAFDLLKEHMKDPANLGHSLETEVIMKALANKLDEDEEYWGNLGLLHDIDWEYGADTHCIKCNEILKNTGFDDTFINNIQSHCWGNSECANGTFKELKRNTKIQHLLAAAETITGLIYATALVRPDKKLKGVEVKSIKKKMKNKSFAAKVDREIIKECEKAEMNLDEFIQISLSAVKTIANEIGI